MCKGTKVENEILGSKPTPTPPASTFYVVLRLNSHNSAESLHPHDFCGGEILSIVLDFSGVLLKEYNKQNRKSEALAENSWI